MWLYLLLCLSWATSGLATNSEAVVDIMQHITIPSTISPYAEAQELSCSELLMHAWSQHCRPAAVARNAKVVVCNSLIQSDKPASPTRPAQETYEATDAGLILLLPDSQEQESGSSGHQQQQQATDQFVWRLRIVGPEIVTLPVQYCPSNVAVAAYRLTVPGEYNVEVLLLYTRFSYMSSTSLSGNNPGSSAASAAAVQKVQSDPHAASFTIKVDTVAEGTLACGARSATSSTANWCPPCQDHMQLGRWMITAQGTARQLVQKAISRTCVHTGSSSSSRHRPRDSSSSSHMEVLGSCSAELRQLVQLQKEQQRHDALLTWHPYSCRPRTLGDQEVTSCRQQLLSQGGSICFVGDSQMKHLAIRVAHLLGLNLPTSTISSSSSSSTMVAFFVDSFGDGSSVAANCSMVFRNFGHRPLSAAAAHASAHTTTTTTSSSNSKHAGQPWTAGRYAAQVYHVAQQLAAERRQRPSPPQVFWVTTNAYPLRADLHHHLGTDLRVDPYLLLFNKLASSIMSSQNIPVVDTYSIASPLSDLLLFEGGLQSLGHVVAMAQAQLVAAVICPAA